MKVKVNKQVKTLKVTADAEGLVSHAGSALLTDLADKVGLTHALSTALALTRKRRSGCDPGQVLRDLAVMLIDGGGALSDLKALRNQGDLFGRVASDSTAWRVIDSIDETVFEGLLKARARARSKVWELGKVPDRLTLDIDATLVGAHSEKEGAAGSYKGSFGFHPLLCYLDETGEGLAGILRPGNAGANTASDHIELLEQALDQLPRKALDKEILVRTDSAGATHDFVKTLREADIRFSVGYDLYESVRQAILQVPDCDWVPALTQKGKQRQGASVSELDLDTPNWPEGTRAICRRERPHPGAQLSFSDEDGYRFQIFLTDQKDKDIAVLEARHRAHARIEDRIHEAKEMGLRNLPFHSFALNKVWLLLVLLAGDLTAWCESLLLESELCGLKPKTLRYRLLHVAGRIVRTGRRVILRLQRDWPWAGELARAFERLRLLPKPG